MPSPELILTQLISQMQSRRDALMPILHVASPKLERRCAVLRCIDLLIRSVRIPTFSHATVPLIRHVSKLGWPIVGISVKSVCHFPVVIKCV